MPQDVYPPLTVYDNSEGAPKDPTRALGTPADYYAAGLPARAEAADEYPPDDDEGSRAVHVDAAGPRLRRAASVCPQ